MRLRREFQRLSQGPPRIYGFESENSRMQGTPPCPWARAASPYCNGRGRSDPVDPARSAWEAWEYFPKQYRDFGLSP